MSAHRGAETVQAKLDATALGKLQPIAGSKSEGLSRPQDSGLDGRLAFSLGPPKLWCTNMGPAIYGRSKLASIRWHRPFDSHQHAGSLPARPVPLIKIRCEGSQTRRDRCLPSLVRMSSHVSGRCFSTRALTSAVRLGSLGPNCQPSARLACASTVSEPNRTAVARSALLSRSI